MDTEFDTTLDFFVPKTAPAVVVDALTKCEEFMQKRHAVSRSLRLWIAMKTCSLLKTLLAPDPSSTLKGYGAIGALHVEMAAEVERRSAEAPAFSKTIVEYFSSTDIRSNLNQSVELGGKMQQVPIPMPSFKKTVPPSVMAFFGKKAVRATNQTMSGLPLEYIPEWIEVSETEVSFKMDNEETPEIGFLVISRILNSNREFMQIGDFGLAAMAAWYTEQFIVGDRDIKFILDAMNYLGSLSSRAALERKANMSQ